MDAAANWGNSFDACCAGPAKAAYTCDPFEMVKAFGPRDLDACRDEETVWLRLVTIAVKEAFSKLRACGEDHRRSAPIEPGEELLIRELFVWGDSYQPRDSPKGKTRVLEHGLASLDPMCRTVFVLKDIEAISMGNIAAIVNRSVAAVEVCLLRARLRLGEMLTSN